MLLLRVIIYSIYRCFKRKVHFNFYKDLLAVVKFILQKVGHSWALARHRDNSFRISTGAK